MNFHALVFWKPHQVHSSGWGHFNGERDKFDTSIVLWKLILYQILRFFEFTINKCLISQGSRDSSIAIWQVDDDKSDTSSETSCCARSRVISPKQHLTKQAALDRIRDLVYNPLYNVSFQCLNNQKWGEERGYILRVGGSLVPRLYRTQAFNKQERT